MTERPEPPLRGDERSTLRTFLDFHRATLAMKCEGLSDEQLRTRSMPPSTLSLLGLVRHMAEVERPWFRRVVAAEDVPFVWSPEGDFQAAYDPGDCTRAEAFAASADLPDGRGVPPRGIRRPHHGVQPMRSGEAQAVPEREPATRSSHPRGALGIVGQHRLDHQSVALQQSTREVPVGAA